MSTPTSTTPEVAAKEAISREDIEAAEVSEVEAVSTAEGSSIREEEEGVEGATTEVVHRAVAITTMETSGIEKCQFVLPLLLSFEWKNFFMMDAAFLFLFLCLCLVRTFAERSLSEIWVSENGYS